METNNQEWKLESIEVRHEIYKNAFEIFKTGFYNGMCSAISRSEINYFPKKRISQIQINLLLERFPEFKKLKPKRKDNNNYWWPIGNTEIRYKKFKLLIEQTKPDTDGNRS